MAWTLWSDELLEPRKNLLHRSSDPNPPGPYILQDILVFPKRHVLSFAELSNAEVVELASSVKLLTSMFEKQHESDSSTIYFREYSSKDILGELYESTMNSQTFGKYFVYIRWNFVYFEWTNWNVCLCVLTNVETSKQVMLYSKKIERLVEPSNS